MSEETEVIKKEEFDKKDLISIIDERMNQGLEKVTADILTAIDTAKKEEAATTLPFQMRETKIKVSTNDHLKSSKFGFLMAGMARVKMQGITIEDYFKERSVEINQYMTQEMRKDINNVQKKNLNLGIIRFTLSLHPSLSQP